MAKISGLASVDIRPEGFSALRHDNKNDNYPGKIINVESPGSIIWPDAPPSNVLELLMNSQQTVARLRAALKTCGFTTEEIDSIAFDTHDGVRVVMEGHIIP